MTNKEMQKLINSCAKSARKTFKDTMPNDENIIDINYGIPYVAIYSGNEEYFFQGDDASNLLEEAISASNKFNTNLENTLLWMAQSW